MFEQNEELKRKSEEMTRLTTQITIQETELIATKEERDQLKQDMNSSNVMGKEEIVKRAWEVRDQAVARKNLVEIELAKTRIEVMHINSQLMEAIQQKVELSQQLEQWQVSLSLIALNIIINCFYHSYEIITKFNYVMMCYDVLTSNKKNFPFDRLTCRFYLMNNLEKSSLHMNRKKKRESIMESL